MQSYGAAPHTGNNPSVILFYSVNCMHSQRFMTLLDKLNIRRHFKCVSVDKVNGQRPRVVTDYGIREVPTIICRNQKIAGQAAFTWLNNEVQEFNRVRSGGMGSEMQMRLQQQQSPFQMQTPNMFGAAGMSSASIPNLPPGSTAGGGSTMLEAMDIGASPSAFGAGGGGSSIGLVGIDGSSIGTGGFAPAGQYAPVSATTISESGFVKPEGYNFQLPGISEHNQAWFNSGANQMDGSGRSASKSQQDYARMMQERDRQDKLFGNNGRR